MHEENLVIFEIMKRLADGLNVTLGENSEIVIHDFSDLTSSLIHVAGNLTQRRIGAPITDLVFKTFKDQGDDIADISGYRTIFNGRIMKSSTTFLRNSSGAVIGCMCINLDVTDILNARAALDKFTQFIPEGIQTSERFASSFQETLESILDEIIIGTGKQPAAMDRGERLDVIRQLNSRDVFIFKGAVNQIARMFGVTRYTIYNDLKEIREEDYV